MAASMRKSDEAEMIESFEAVARELTSDLDPERKGILLDLEPQRRRTLFRTLHDLALEQLERLDLSAADRDEARTRPVILGQTALEDQGLFLLAAALYLLAHDESFSMENPGARFERPWLRLKLAHALLLADEDSPENIRRCADIVRWTIPLADVLWNHPGLQKDAVLGLQYQLHSWLAERYSELDLFRDAADHFSQACVAARTANDRVSAALGLADCYAKQGDPQRANEMLMLQDGEIGEVDDEEVLERWEIVREQLRFSLGGSLDTKEWSNAPQWSFLERSASNIITFDRHLDDRSQEVEEAIAALEDMLAQTPPEDMALRCRLLAQLASFSLASGNPEKASAAYQQARKFEAQLRDEPEKLRLRILGARLRRHGGDASGACADYRALLPAALRLLNDDETLDLLGHFLEALAHPDALPNVEEIRSLSREVLARFERQLQQIPSARARRRFREIRQRALEGALAALVGAAERLSMESGPGQELLSDAWRMVLAVRHPELSRRATNPALDTAAHVRKLEDEFHRLVRDFFVEGTGRDSFTAAMERLSELEFTILRNRLEETQVSFEPPAEGRALAYFHFREMSSDRPVLVLGCRDGRIDAGLLPDDLRWGNAYSIRDLFPPSLAWLLLPEVPWFFFLDGKLHELNLEWLSQGTDPAPWFGKDRGIQICLRSSIHPATRRRVDFSRGWLGAGGVPGRGKLSDLPETRREIEQIRGFLDQRGFPADALLGDQANAVRLRERLASLRPAVLHVAAHGCIDREYPDAGCLFLAEAPGAPEREMLPFRRVLELDLKGVDLVVLSACKSSSGRSSRTAGLEGLAWAFLQAGAAQVVASRSPVDETATADLMAVFYHHLQHLPAAEALGRTRTECLATGMEKSEVGAWSVLS